MPGGKTFLLRKVYLHSQEPMDQMASRTARDRGLYTKWEEGNWEKGLLGKTDGKYDSFR